jgi:hypothetical protein
LRGIEVREGGVGWQVDDIFFRSESTARSVVAPLPGMESARHSTGGVS